MAMRIGGTMEVRKPKEWDTFPEIREMKNTQEMKEIEGSEETPGRKEGFTMLKGEKGYTVADIEALPEGERAELIDGELFRMDAPTWAHQEIQMALSAKIWNFITEHRGPCRVMPAPFAVYIKRDKLNYVEPDISVICDEEKKSEKGCQGAPDWMIEIVSPSSKTMDYERKVKLYREAGAREYWIVDPETQTVTVYDFEQEVRPEGITASRLVDDASGEQTASVFEPAHYSFAEKVKVGIFEDLWVDFSKMDHP